MGVVVVDGVLGWGNRKSGLEAYGPGGRWDTAPGNTEEVGADRNRDGDLLGDALDRAGASEGATLLVVAESRFESSALIARLKQFIADGVPSDGIQFPQPFVLERFVDETGVSGVGIVAEGVLFTDGRVALRWTSATPTSVVFHDRGIESVEKVHGHDGKTRIRWQ